VRSIFSGNCHTCELVFQTKCVCLDMCSPMMQCVAVCCGVLQCIAVCQ